MTVMFKIKVGLDLQHVPTFAKSLQDGGSVLRSKLFTQNEQKENQDIEKLAGVFTAKEAVVKALGKNFDQYNQLEIKKLNSGKPVLAKPLEILKENHSLDISISHDGKYVAACCVFLTNAK